MNKPQPQVLVIWRVLLVLAAFAAALLASVLLGVGSASWLIAICLIALLFLGYYLAYFPLLYKRMAFTIKNEAIVFTTGVFKNREISVPLSAIQFATVSQSVFGRVFGLSNVTVTAAGGRVVIPGLKTADAEALARALDI